MILVDSSVWIDYFRGVASPQTDRLDELLGTAPVAIGDLMLAEVLQGFPRDEDYLRARRLLGSLTVFDLVGRSIAWRAAGNYRALRARGAIVRMTIDNLIATFCIAHGHALLFSDRDFEPFVRWLGLRSAMDGLPAPRSARRPIRRP